MSAAVQLFCLPHAGAGAGAYRGWSDLLAPHVEVLPMRLPGRELRRRTPPARSVAELVADLMPQLLAAADRPFALFGHSMGALVSYELTHALCATGRSPSHLFVSGQPAPHRGGSNTPDVHTLPDDDLVDRVASLSGTPEEVLAHPAMVNYLVPILRADFGLCERYRHEPRPPLAVPITALGGVDDEHLGGDRLTAWGELTTADTAVHHFPGGHFYLHEHLPRVTATVHAALLSPRPRENTP